MLVSEPPSPASDLIGSLDFWVALDLAVSFAFLVWALVFRRAWRLVPYLLYWFLALVTGLITFAFYNSNSWFVLLPWVCAGYLGMPWNYFVDPWARMRSDLPGQGLVAYWIGILINQGLLALLASTRRTARAPGSERIPKG